MPKLFLSGSPTFNADGTCTINSTGSDVVQAPAGNIPNAQQLWVAVRAKVGFASTDVTNRRFFTWGANTNDELFLEWASNAWLATGRDSAGSQATGIVTPPAFAVGSDHTMIGQWNSTTVYASWDGSALIASGIGNAFNPPVPRNFDIGVRAYTPANWTESDYYWVAIGVGMLSDADVTALHAIGNTDPTFSALPKNPIFLWTADSQLFQDGSAGRAILDIDREPFPFIVRADWRAEGASPPTLSDASPAPSGGFERFIYPRLHPVFPGTGINQAIGQALEDDLALAFARLKLKTIGQSLETEIAQIIHPLRSYLIGQALETDISQPVGKAKARLIGQVIETDIAQAIGKAKARAFVQAIETDIAQAIGHARAKAFAQATETDIAQSFGKTKAKAFVQALETDIAQPIIKFGVAGAVGRVTETDISQQFTAMKGRTLGLPVETDLALAIGHSRAKAFGLITETDLAQPISRIKSRSILQAVETDLAFAVGRLHSKLIGQVVEVDIAQPIGRQKFKLIGQAIETDTALQIFPTKPSVSAKYPSMIIVDGKIAIGLGGGYYTKV